MWQRLVGGMSGAMSVATGAYAAHGLKGKKESYIKVFETGSRYQLIHSAILVATPAICGKRSRAGKIAGAFFATGILLFSGSCYAVGLREDRSLGKMAPVGGFALIGGWLSLAIFRK
mmetsp:Transcript_18854/g.27879  ORF Transcript_18854/g.27879 Transcript_18854/m.27879 type:complete len:117 (-) Transcript_18854:183-533(-)